MANIRLSVITHIDRPIDLSKTGETSIGQMIDEVIHDSLSHGNVIQEVKFMVEESEAHNMLDSFYDNRRNRINQEVASEVIARKSK